ncbi:MAG: hypothetical protein AAFR98_10590 [Pseudomonadota bacterium]
MCITTQALTVFLSILSQDLIERSPDRIIVHASAEDTVWVKGEDDLWCVDRPLGFDEPEKS